jgi:hypothetical protein
MNPMLKAARRRQMAYQYSALATAGIPSHRTERFADMRDASTDRQIQRRFWVFLIAMAAVFVAIALVNW